MFQTVLRSAELPPEQRAAVIDEVIRINSKPGVSRDRNLVVVRAAELATVNVQEITVEHRRVVGAASQPDGPGRCGVIIAMRGALTLEQRDRRAELAAGDFAVYDYTDPASFLIRSPGPATARLMRLQVRRDLLPLRGPRISRLAAVRMPGGPGVTGLLSRFLTGLADDPAPYSAGDRARLGTVVTDLLAAALAHQLDVPATTPGESRRAALLAGVRTYIQRNLGDPGLSPATIAAANHISVSYLHRLFQTEGVTVAAWVREQRLDRARRDLTDPAQAGTPVGRIATRWGYPDHATFTRAFRDAYDLPPRTYRENALAESG